jgi:hypothetical protein
MENNSSTGSSTNLELAASWLHDCTNYHEHCHHQPQKKSTLPLRVLDVGDRETKQKLFLSVGEDRIGSYAALSYSWGKSKRKRKYLTTKQNLEQRQATVDDSNFPKTFTNAIVVCRHLGIRFLWIDSLCIIQDDESDWKMQSERMGDIYANATLTISAAVGEDSDSGLFVDRDPRKTYPCTLSFQYPKENGHITQGAFLTCLDSYLPRIAYLDTRGWTFQEKYLSPRTLHFSKTEMYWICASSNASEGLPMGLNPLNNKSDFDKYIMVDKHGALATQVDMVQRYYWWYQAMEIYSYRNFTFESDRLIALAGLASKFQWPRDEFLYGIWKSDLVHGLAWRVGGQKTVNATDTSPKSPIPSWSWASRPGNIIIFSKSDSNPELRMGTHESITLYQIPEGSLQHAFIEVLSIEPMTPAVNQSVSSTSQSLRLRGLLSAVSPTKRSLAYNDSNYSTSTSMGLFRNVSSLRNQTVKQFLGDALYDEPVAKDENLYCLPLSVLPSYQNNSNRSSDSKAQIRQPFGDISIDQLVSFQNLSIELGIGALPTMTWCAGPISCCRLTRKDTLSCLLLKKVDAEGMKFRRVGYLESMDGRLFEGLAPVTLEII